MSMRCGRFAITVAMAFAAIACGDGTSPLAPPNTNLTAGTSGSAAVGISGTIQSVSAPDTIVVSGQSVRTNGSTSIRQGSLPLMFNDLRAGLSVDISAVNRDGALTAASIDVRDAGGTIGTPTRVRGIVQEVTGSPGDFLVRTNNGTVRGSADSAIRSGSQTRAAGDLRPGDDVDIDGRQRTGYTYAAAIDVMVPADGTAPPPSPTPVPNPPSPGPSPGPGPGPSPGDVTLTGTVGPIVGVCPLLVTSVDSQPIVTTTSTTFAVAACQDLRTGDRVEVSGRREADGRPIVAYSIRRQ